MSKYRFKKLKTIWRERWEAEQEGNKENVPPFVINGSLKSSATRYEKEAASRYSSRTYVTTTATAIA
ncbi:uncharacterized protein ACA1_097770 [Acanthamoeba castellanii str. Neff]|uniref:Uncharacterized protein n=1 Tax=Acanthamoeba castellanii (strain ATCC 30010 / Neff) TaxID=1257118 RepID=L8GLN4_ACACF|nr:uncharacterized protein ACA1_097770 [Acanthamoeba castellanii str. Neff]ELR13091.1 hypothetical protein ACA1_097770 [Acanthamoeba castellanii str. Neff]